MESTSASSQEASTSGLPLQDRISVHIPHSMLTLPPTAAAIGLIMGMSRGGSRARLRFLAENAHRMPTTVQGWYFYSKTRNYRIIFGALRTGSRYALGLGALTSLYVLVEEGTGWARERVFRPNYDAVGNKGKGRESDGWRVGPVHWEDGAAAGTVLGMVIGVANKLPTPILMRVLFLGTVLGSATSGMRILQAHVGQLRDEEEAAKAREAALLAPPTVVDSPGSQPVEHDVVDRRIEPGSPVVEANVEKTSRSWLRWGGL